MIRSGTLAWNKLLAPVAHRLWFVLLEIPASALISFIMDEREFFPTGFSSYHGASGSEGHLGLAVNRVCRAQMHTSEDVSSKD